MDQANRFELHYYFNEHGHEINALVRNKCEAELLAILIEAASLLDIEADLIAEAYREGGFRDIWKFLGKNANSLTVLALIAQIIIAAIPLFDSESSDLEKELNQLSIEEKKLQIEKLKKELRESQIDPETIKQAADTVGKSLKIIKRKSNFYSHLERYPKVTEIGISALNDDFHPISNELIVPRADFSKFVLSTNKLRSNEDDNAIIEIVSPVLKEGRFKWKGVYDEKIISFEMQDSAFRDAVLLENISFQHGTKITCVLVMHREIDEVGEIRITDYAVTTVIEKIDGDHTIETLQGKKYRHAKKLAESQGDLFNESANQ
ncbi:hypothetical protein R2103_11550 [Nitrosomonas sp. Is24]|uniref:hypothetical protein n=1 Tax=Nitrosomonas sp. Is24 TaxID=3080533 RepID=UPI00294ADE45|nr:hypothetical protein [Nitrosomonas sp. Is24]MDV6342401.1 hypothetical protein [Nitrosomonas sp. Is24]